jgi:hypothetical protein
MLTMFANIMLWIIYIGDVKRNVARHVTHDVTPCLLTLANRNDPICVVSPKMAKASTTCVAVAVAGVIAGTIALTFVNGNTAAV